MLPSFGQDGVFIFPAVTSNVSETVCGLSTLYVSDSVLWRSPITKRCILPDIQQHVASSEVVFIEK